MTLTGLIFLPFIFAISLLLIPSRYQKLIPWIALAFATIEFFYSLGILSHFDKYTADLQMVEHTPWISSLGISYFIGIDGISLPLVILTTFILPFMILGSFSTIKDRSFYFHLLVLESLMLGSFLAMDAILFYTFFESSLIPMYFLMGLWGGPRRIYASVKFFIFTMFGSVFMLVAIIAMMFAVQTQLGTLSANILDFYQIEIPFILNIISSPQTLMFLAFSLAFAIKVPLFPLHTWLPDAHVEAPTAGSVVLASIMLKMGGYGLIRWVIPLFPQATENLGWIFLVLGVIGIIYGACVAMVQTDIKKLVAYSSVSHMGYVIVGLFALNIYGFTGGFYQMLNHGISTGALFLLVGIIYERTKTRDIQSYGGLASAMPLYAIAFFIITLSSIAVPGTNGFIGELLILLGVFTAHKGIGILAVLGVILGAVYMLWMFKAVFFGKQTALVKKLTKGHERKDLHLREIILLLPFVILVFWMGIFPQTFLSYSQASLDHLVHHQKTYTLTVPGNVLKNQSPLLERENITEETIPNITPTEPPTEDSPTELLKAKATEDKATVKQDAIKAQEPTTADTISETQQSLDEGQIKKQLPEKAPTTQEQ